MMKNNSSSFTGKAIILYSKHFSCSVVLPIKKIVFYNIFFDQSYLDC